MSTSTNSSFFDSIPFKCDKTYDPVIEFMKYVLQALYLIPGNLLIIRMLYVLLISQRKIYQDNYFYQFYIIDLLASFYDSFLDLIFARFFMYITPLCDIIGPFFFDFSIFLQVTNVLYDYCRAMKSVTQVLLTSNRMTCVIFPLQHKKIWKSNFKVIVTLTFLAPILIIWNEAISRNYMVANFGGFHVNHKKLVAWASLSKFQLSFITVALVITAVNTFLTLYGLQNMAHRVKTTERNLCITSFMNSFGFLCAGVFQFVFAFCTTCNFSLLFGVQFLTFDLINIGSPLMMVIMNAELRSHVFNIKIMRKSTRISVMLSHSGS